MQSSKIYASLMQQINLNHATMPINDVVKGLKAKRWLEVWFLTRESQPNIDVSAMFTNFMMQKACHVEL